MEIRPIQYL